MINKQPDVDTPRLTRAVEQRVEQLNASLPEGVQVSQTFRQAQFIDIAIRNVSESLLLGVVIVAAVLVLFLMNWRTAVITLSAIPLSLLVGLLLMRWLGLQLNTMTLGGLVVAIGSVVDDAIVDMENCYWACAAIANCLRPTTLEVVFRTSVEVRQPVLFSTLIIVVVFAPIFTLTGVEGRIFMPMGIAYVRRLWRRRLWRSPSPALCALLLSRARCRLKALGLSARQHGSTHRSSIWPATPRRVLALALATVVRPS